MNILELYIIFVPLQSSVRANFESLSLEFGELEKRNFESGNIRGSNARCSNAKTNNGNSAGNETANPGNHNSPGSLGNPGGQGNPMSPVSDGLLEHICSHLVLFTKARLQMIALYPLGASDSVLRIFVLSFQSQQNITRKVHSVTEFVETFLKVIFLKFRAMFP